MNQKELKELIDFLIEKDISEFELERGDVKVKIKRGTNMHPPVVSHFVPATPQPAVPVPAVTPTASVPVSPSVPSEGDETLHIVKSPIVGTFYESPAPGSLPFVKVGDMVAAGQILCIIEAMKLMNEIESDAAGEIVNRRVT